ncbi:MAG TPA: hypothetical protein VD860_16935 [Azospirillum sp.]|nr:hypothetical protein [Azospirillum sp.]
MLVRQLVGAHAGELIDLPYDAATRCIEAGSALPHDAPWPPDAPVAPESEKVAPLQAASRRRA